MKTINRLITRIEPVLIAPYLLALTSTVVLLFLILLGQYANPSADDFCMAAGVRHDGLLSHLYQHYQEWSGRYAGNALYAIYPLLFGLFDGYRFMPVLLILSLISACAFFLSRLFKISINHYLVVLVSLVFTAIYLIGMVSQSSSLYWMAGALTYQSANILLLFTLGLMIELHDRQVQGRAYPGVFAILLILIVLGIGLNEISMLGLTATLVLGFIFHIGWHKNQGQARATYLPWLLLMITALFCFAVVYYAPGTMMRESTFPLRHQWGRALSGSLNMGLWTLTSWIKNPVLLVASFLAPFGAYFLYQDSQRKIKISIWLLLVLPLITFLIPLVLQFPAWWAMGGWPPARTVDAIYFVFLLGWFLSIGAFSLRFMPTLAYKNTTTKAQTQQRSLSPSQPSSQQGISGIILLACAILFLLAVLTNGKFQRVQVDLFERAKPYHDYILQRYETINDALAHQQYSVQVPSYQGVYPRSIYFNDILPFSRDWRNVCYADYFGLQKIRRMKRKRPDRGLKKRGFR